VPHDAAADPPPMTASPPDRTADTAAPAAARAAWDAHASSLTALNEDRGDAKAPGDACATPLRALAKFLPSDHPIALHAGDVGFRLDSVAFFTRGTSYEAWSAITQIETMFSDIRRIAPRFAFAQLRGEARIAAGNEYRRAIADPSYLDRLNAARAELDAALGSGAARHDPMPITVRRMDLRILHAGPFGGETATMTWSTLASHRLAGLSSFWAVIHGDDDGLLRVTLEAAELFRWAWAAERLVDLRATPPPGEEARILDWRWYFERIADALDADPVADATRTRAVAGRWSDIGGDPALREALAAHPALADLAARLDGGA
jgi:hypothetical protein